MMRPLGSAPLGSRRRRIAATAAPGGAPAELGAPVYLLEVEARLPGSATVPYARGLGAAPAGALRRRLATRELTTLLRASDAGYRTGPGDAPGVVAYPAVMTQPFGLERLLGVSPTSAGATAAWGRAVLSNADRRYDGVAQRFNADGRRARILSGRQIWDGGRGLWRDPPYSSLTEIFAGVAEPWSLTETSLEIPLRDVSYLLERTLQTGTYAGTGGYEGTADMAGRLRPLVVGGTPASPVRQVTPVLVDPVARIYDAGGPVVRLYEGGDPTNIPYDGDVADLYSGTWPLGTYRTCNARGLFQVHAAPAFALTVDVAVGGNTAAASLARALLTRALVPDALVDEASFLGLAAAAPWTSGWWWGEAVDAAAAVKFLLASVGARLVTGRSGRLRAVRVAALPAGTRPVATYSAAQIVSLVPVDLGAPLSPSPAAWQVGWGRNHTVQTSGLDGGLDAAAAAALGQAWRQVGADNPQVLLTTRRPSRPELVETAQLTSAGAASLAAGLRDLWSQPRPARAYRMTVPGALAMRHEAGDPIVVAYPADDLDAGRLCQVVGDGMTAGGDTGTYTILT